MLVDLKKIAPLVRQQFPSFYEQEGPNFIEFVEAYYEWLDQQGPTYYSRNLLEYSDIDQASNQFVDHFITKYMNGIPYDILSDKRLMEKHILDIYRSKGSIGGLKLLFRLLYNLEADIYLPKTDIFMASAGKWTRRQYIEVEQRPLNLLYGGKSITGSTSGAKAFVTLATRIFTGYQIAHVMYLLDIMPGPSGSGFIVGEYISYDGMDLNEATLIKGSPVSATVTSSSEDHAIGDILYTQNTTGEGLQFQISSILDADHARGYIDFLLYDGGYGYCIDSVVTAPYLTASRGSGAGFKVKSIGNTETFTYNLNPANNMAGLYLNATTYGANLHSANSQSLISSALSYANITIGSITGLTAVTSGDHNYNGSVNPNVFEQRTWGYGIHDKNGNIWGNNAVIYGNAASGNGVADAVILYSSGYGYNTDQQKLKFYNTKDTTYTVDLVLNIGAIGHEEGTWEGTNSFLNADKYLTDSNYYQAFSYEVQIEKSLDKYISILKQVMHPVGNKVFGKPVIVDSTNIQENIVVDQLSYKTTNGTVVVAP